MPTEDIPTNGEWRTNRSRQRFALVYWQQEGARYYLRVTPLGLYIVFFLVAASIAALIFFFWLRKSHTPAGGVNIDITTPPGAAASPVHNVIKAAPPGPTPPKVNTRSSETAPKKRQSGNVISTNERETQQPRQ